MTDPSSPKQPGAAPDEPPTVQSPPVFAPDSEPRRASSPVAVDPGPAPGSPPAPAPASVESFEAPATRTRPRRWWRILRAVLLVILLPCAALGIGLLIAWIAHLIRNDGGNIGTRPAASVTPPASPSASASASAGPKVVVPADWVTEVSPPAGLSYRHPAGWIRRTQSPEVFRFAPASAGSTDPGVEGVGAGFEMATDPAQALQSFAARAYGDQPNFVAQPVTAVTGGNPDEKQGIVTYTRSGASVRVVMHSFRLQGHTVLALGRSLNATPARAALLESYVEASLKFSS